MQENNLEIEALRSATELINSIETIHPELFPQLFDYLYSCKSLNDFCNLNLMNTGRNFMI